MSRLSPGWLVIGGVVALSVWASSPYSSILLDPLEYVPGGDKTGHVLIMGLLAAGCVIAFTGRLWRGRPISSRWILLLVALGVTADEFIQLAVPSRTFSWLDLLASLAGVAFFGALAAAWVARRQRPDLPERV